MSDQRKYTYKTNGSGPDTGYIQKIEVATGKVIAKALFNDFFDWSYDKGVSIHEAPQLYFDHLNELMNASSRKI
jgi:hypothetical protein